MYDFDQIAEQKRLFQIQDLQVRISLKESWQVTDVSVDEETEIVTYRKNGYGKSTNLDEAGFAKSDFTDEAIQLAFQQVKHLTDEGRAKRAIAIVSGSNIITTTPGVYRIESSSSDQMYRTTYGHCTCEDRAKTCKHKIAAMTLDILWRKARRTFASEQKLLTELGF